MDFFSEVMESILKYLFDQQKKKEKKIEKLSIRRNNNSEFIPESRARVLSLNSNKFIPTVFMCPLVEFIFLF